jgi:hypothetical protein
MSVLRTVANTERTQFYVNTATCVNVASSDGSDFYNSSGVAIAIAPVASADVITAGAIIVRDMGKTVRLTNTAGGAGIRILRKVQRVYFSGLTANEGIGTLATVSPAYGTFYIEMLNTSDAGTYRATKWARLTIPN